MNRSDQNITVHKKNTRAKAPLVSVILLDWSVRERFHTLDWLNKQNLPRDDYELIWVELYDRVPPEAMDKADVVITCGQKGTYAKHKGYNVGYLHARGHIVNVCDSDAVFPPDFISSIRKTFTSNGSAELESLVLMHDEFRNNESSYPDGISTIEEVRGYPWLPLWKNFGACISFRRIDAIRFGGWDEHRSFRGFFAGADLPWRLINAGLPHIWHDASVCLYHFAHPHPEASYKLFSFDLKMWRELLAPTVHGAPLTAVESFATGRVLPLRENSEIHAARMALRTIGSDGETMIGNLPIPVGGFTKVQVLKMYLKFYKYKLFVLLKYSFRRPRSATS
jgi:glycosyltransferase involved in cell wall biosynthesis